jgi:hypothetical protein
VSNPLIALLRIVTTDDAAKNFGSPQKSSQIPLTYDSLFLSAFKKAIE